MRGLAGIALMAGAMACFAAMDTTTKFLSVAVPALMVIWARSVFQLGLVCATLLPRRGLVLLRTRHPMLQGGRALLLLGTALTGYIGIRAMPLPEFTAIVLLTPLALTVVSAVGRRQPVPAFRWACVVAGFAGALLVLRPQAHGTGAVALLALAIVAANTAYQWVTSRVARIDDAGTTQFYTGAVGTVVTSLGVPFVWQALSSLQWLQVGLVCVLGMSGHQLLILAYGRGVVSQLAPYLYLQLVFAALSGWLMFAHAPDTWTLAGLAMIGASGVLGAAMERRRSLAASAAEQRLSSASSQGALQPPRIS